MYFKKMGQWPGVWAVIGDGAVKERCDEKLWFICISPTDKIEARHYGKAREEGGIVGLNENCKKTECYDVTFQNYNALQKRAPHTSLIPS